MLFGDLWVNKRSVKFYNWTVKAKNKTWVQLVDFDTHYCELFSLTSVLYYLLLLAQLVKELVDFDTHYCELDGLIQGVNRQSFHVRWDVNLLTIN